MSFIFCNQNGANIFSDSMNTNKIRTIFWQKNVRSTSKTTFNITKKKHKNYLSSILPIPIIQKYIPPIIFFHLTIYSYSNSGPQEGLKICLGQEVIEDPLMEQVLLLFSQNLRGKTIGNCPSKFRHITKPHINQRGQIVPPRFLLAYPALGSFLHPFILLVFYN